MQISNCIVEPPSPKSSDYSRAMEGFYAQVDAYKSSVNHHLPLLTAPIAELELSKVNACQGAAEAEANMLRKKAIPIGQALVEFQNRQGQLNKLNEEIAKTFNEGVRGKFNTSRRRCRWYHEEFLRAHAITTNGKPEKNGFAQVSVLSTGIFEELKAKKAYLEKRAIEAEHRCQ